MTSIVKERLPVRFSVTLIVISILLVAAYVLVVRFYNAEGGIRVDGGVLQGADTALVVTVEPLSVNAVADTATIRLTFDSPNGALLDENGRLAQGLRASVLGSDGTQEFLFPAGSALGRAEVEIGTDGEVASYPFDVHAGFMGIITDTYTRGAGGAETSTGQVPLGARATGGVSGWDTAVVIPKDVDDSLVIRWSFDRAFSNELFAIVLLSLGAILSILAFVVAVRVFTRRQHFDVPLLAWTASLLFALPLLRTYLPGAPPIGAAIDIYVYLWVVVIAVIAAALTALSAITHRAVKPATDETHGA